MIREFDLDASTLPREDRSAFGFQARHVTRLYERVFGERLVLGKAWKLMVDVVPERTHAAPLDLLGVIQVQVVHRAEDLLACAEDLEKSRMALRWLVEGLCDAAGRLGVPATLFSAAADRVTALGFENIERWIKPTRSPDRKRRADVVVDFGVHEAKVIGRIIDAKGAVTSERVLAVTQPSEFIVAPVIGALRWESDTTLALWPRGEAGPPLRWSVDAARG